ncbi:rheacalcin-1-like [Pituophis catenifer annectens]|uniref:rheacalcin-1-like n=1 Tax=Pituophis catenifer annectens TaxID=94852 RepID=UPI003992420E
MRDAGRERCPQGWMTSGGACYRIFQEKRTWKAAERECRSLGVRGHLASILDAEETKDVALYITSSPNKDLGPVWIGMFYKGKNSPQGDWWWIDSYKILYSNWIKGLPKISYGKYCVYLEEYDYKYWKETDCIRDLAYLCKYELKYQRR